MVNANTENGGALIERSETAEGPSAESAYYEALKVGFSHNKMCRYNPNDPNLKHYRVKLENSCDYTYLVKFMSFLLAQRSLCLNIHAWCYENSDPLTARGRPHVHFVASSKKKITLIYWIKKFNLRFNEPSFTGKCNDIVNEAHYDLLIHDYFLKDIADHTSFNSDSPKVSDDDLY